MPSTPFHIALCFPECCMSTLFSFNIHSAERGIINSIQSYQMVKENLHNMLIQPFPWDRPPVRVIKVGLVPLLHWGPDWNESISVVPLRSIWCCLATKNLNIFPKKGYVWPVNSSYKPQESSEDIFRRSFTISFFKMPGCSPPCRRLVLYPARAFFFSKGTNQFSVPSTFPLPPAAN